MTDLADIIEPMPGRIAVQVATKDEFTGGLWIPYDTAKSVHEGNRPVQGVIVALGDEDEDAEVDFAIGDTVVFGKYSGTEITWWPDRTKPKQKVIILSEKDILARLNRPEEAENLQIKG